VLGVTALGLDLSFGEDSGCYGDLGTWPDRVAFSAGRVVDYGDLADRLLRALVPEYVPGEVGGAGEGGDL
jgi:hypothetical protein